MMNRSLVATCAAAAAAAAVLCSGIAAQADVIFQENFDTLPLRPKVEEPAATTPADRPVWTNVAPAGWVKDDTSVPGYNNPADNNGRAEWIGWAFADKSWWGSPLVDTQQRENFTKSSGNVMVADPDEWDDAAHPDQGAGYTDLYDAFVTTPSISLANVVSGTGTIRFDSSWRAEGFDDGQNLNNQTATVTMLFNNGASVEVMRWDSDEFGLEAGEFFHADNVNESVSLAMPATPAGATAFQLRFGLGRAANDWWWAVDNIAVDATVVPEPTSAALLAAAAAVPLMRRRRRAR